MTRIARAVEPSLGYRHQLPSALEEPTVGRAMSNAACDLAEALGAKAILVPTFTGRTASAVARLRPRRPVVALTHVQASLQHMAIEWGVTPLEIPEVTDVEELWRDLDRHRARRGDRGARRPRRPHRRHGREHPGLHERHQGRRRLGQGRRLARRNPTSWQGGPRTRCRRGDGGRVRASGAGGFGCSGRSGSSASPSTSTTGRSRPTSRPVTT